MSNLSLQFLLDLSLLSIISLHIMKKDFAAVIAYGAQSLVIIMVLANSFFETGQVGMLLVIVLIFVVKVILAPLFFIRLIKKYSGKVFSGSTYLSTPLTLIMVAVLVFAAHSEKFTPLTNIIQTHHALLSLSLSMILLSIFLVVNRKGALSQIIGVLSLENSIVLFAIFAGLEQSANLQIGIFFDIFIWIMIATVFIAMLHKHFGTLNVSSMKKLID